LHQTGIDEAPLYLKNKTQYLSDANHNTLRNVVSEKLQIPKAKTELFKKTFTHSGIKL
jgi:NOL1/NOP2/fmu family ribosome biogenesis protein